MRLTRTYHTTIIRIEQSDRTLFAAQVKVLEDDLVGGIPEAFRDYNPLNGEWAIKGQYASIGTAMAEAYVKATKELVDAVKGKEKA
jgi:hypothetical protein